MWEAEWIGMIHGMTALEYVLDLIAIHPEPWYPDLGVWKLLRSP